MRRTIQTTSCFLALAVCASPLFGQQSTPAPAPAAKAAAAPAAKPTPLALSYLNKELPSWLKFSGEYRMRFEGFEGGSFKANTSDAYDLSRLRLNMRVAPSSFMRFQVQMQDSQVFFKNSPKPDAAPFENTMDLRQGYVEFGKAEAPAVLLKVGRQEMFFGEQRLIGHLNWTNTARSFDAARMTLTHKNYKVDLFSATVVNFREETATNPYRWDKSAGGNDLHGAYGSITKVIPNATIEPYVFWRLARGTKTETGIPGKTDRVVYGTRFAGKIAKTWDYSIEEVGQTGSVGADNIRAMASHVAVGYTITGLKKKPRLIAEYNYASGDKTPGDGKQQTFDQLYPTGHDKLGLSDQVGWKNIHDLRAGVEYKQNAKLSFNGSYHDWWLASARDALYTATGAALVKVAAGTAGKHVGQELDGQMTYTVNATMSIGAGYANVFPGQFLKTATPGKPYRFPYAMLTYSF